MTTLLAVILLAGPGARALEPAMAEPRPIGAAAAELDLTGLAEGVRGTRAISFIAKLEVKSRADRLLDDMQRYHAGRGGDELTSLEARFDALLAWLVSLVSPADPELHERLVASRDAIWRRLADPRSFHGASRRHGSPGADHGR